MFLLPFYEKKCLFGWSFYFPSSFVLFSCDLLTNFSIVFRFFFFFVCVSIVYSQFAVTMRFWYSSLYINKIVLNFWSSNFKCISNICIRALFSQLLILTSYWCADDLLRLFYVCLTSEWAFLFIIFFFLVVAFSA